MPACHAGGRGFEPLLRRQFAQIAQLVEQWTENPRVAGSIPALGTTETAEALALGVFVHDRANNLSAGKKYSDACMNTCLIKLAGDGFLW